MIFFFFFFFFYFWSFLVFFFFQYVSILFPTPPPSPGDRVEGPNMPAGAVATSITTKQNQEKPSKKVLTY